MNKFELLPAIDIKDGISVRPMQGRVVEGANYGSPVESAIDFQAAGAKWLHLVDLDAAYGVGSNSQLLIDVINSVDIKIELSGGICDLKTLSTALATNCDRIVLSTAALNDLSWSCEIVKKYGQKIVVSLDIKDGVLAARGVKSQGGDVLEAIKKLTAAGCSHFIVTDVSKDGSLLGSNFELLEKVCSSTNVPVIASGGISSLADLEKLITMQSIGISGAIVGKALYEGRFTLAQALTLINNKS